MRKKFSPSNFLFIKMIFQYVQLSNNFFLAFSGTSSSNVPLNTPVFSNVPAQPIKILQRPNSNKNLNELAKQNQNKLIKIYFNKPREIYHERVNKYNCV